MKKLGLNLKTIPVKTKEVPNQILDALYLTNYEGASDRDQLRSLNITHIITALTASSAVQFPQDFVYLQVPVGDFHYENLIPFFPSTCEFIEKAVSQNGKVLVHCSQGISRSATIVIAYIMKQNPSLSVDEAVKLVQTKRPQVLPNPSFFDQLHLWKQLNYSVPATLTHAGIPPPEFRAYRAKALALEWKKVEHTKSGAFPGVEALDRLFGPDPEETPSEQGESPSSVLICKNCKRKLAHSHSILEHPKGRPPHDRPELLSKKPIEELVCPGFYIEPVKWMGPEIFASPVGTVVGPSDNTQTTGDLDKETSTGTKIEQTGGEQPLLCRKCSSPVGRWTWASTLCTCCTMVSPSFLLFADSVELQ